MLRERRAVLTGVGLGIGLMYFLDPSGGRHRRALVKDRLAYSAARARQVGTDGLGATARDLANRASGAAARIRSAFGRPADDDVLLDRLRGQIGGAVSHPAAIEVEASDRHVILRGHVLQSEVARLLDAVERVSGVREIVNALDVHKTAFHVPSLGGGTSRLPRLDMFQRRWSPAMRLLVGAAGTVLAGYGASRRDMPGTMLAAAGAGLVARAATNLGARHLTENGTRRRIVDVPFPDTRHVPPYDAQPSIH
jgi:BON domain-containing protein